MSIDALCVGAHPDDVEIGMGATVAAMVGRGAKVAIVDLTDGEPTPKGDARTRAAEAAEAARILGVERRTLTLPNRSLSDTVEARTALAEVIRELRPRVLFGPYGVDAHPDHVAGAAIVQAARFYAKFTKTEMAGDPHYPAKLYQYLALHLKVVVKPSFVASLTEESFERKLTALRAYASQFVVNERNAHVLELVQRQGATWGAAVGAAYGEPFVCVEEIGVTDPLSLV